MKKNLLLLALAMVSVMVMSLGISCSEHEDDIEHFNVKVGDILLSDNNFVQADRYDASKNAIGVVMHVSNDSVWVVSSKDFGQQSYLDTLMSVTSVSSTLSDLNGRENTAALLLSGRVSEAANAATSMDNISSIYGWYLPSIGELRLISNNLGTISESMNKINGDAFSSSPYLSSSQYGSSTETQNLYAYCITLQSGLVSSILKTERGQVRAVLRMKMR